MLAIGDELVDGQLVETNSGLLARVLREHGQSLDEVRLVRDEKAEILRALSELSQRSDRLLVSGGLGITRDDLTRSVLAEFLGVPLQTDSQSLEAVQKRVTTRGRSFDPRLEDHARHPEGSQILLNPAGLAIGFEAEHSGCQIAVFPGVPHEFDVMVHAWAERLPDGQVTRRYLTLFGLTEGHVEERIGDLELPPALHVGICPLDGPLEVSLSGPASMVESQLEAVEAVLAEHVLGSDASVEELLGGSLIAHGASLATAESCTGGLIGSLITDVAGSSAYFLEGAVTYSNAAKMHRLGVRENTLKEHGAVSEATVREMARGIRDTAASDWGVASSGIAGPGGGTAEKPVGLVHLCVAGPSGEVHRAVYFPGVSRERVKRRAAYAALTMLLCAVEGKPIPRLSAPLPALPQHG